MNCRNTCIINNFPCYLVSRYKMGSCLIMMKVFLITFSIFLWAIAAGVMYGITAYFISINGLSSLTEGSNTVYTLVPLILIIVVALVLVVLGIVGIVGAVIGNKVLLVVFSSILIVVMVVQVGVGILAVVFRGEVVTSIETGFQVNIQRFNSSTAVEDTVNFIQSNLQCCGVTNVTDWDGQTLPDSCCSNNDCEDNEPFSVGCLSLIQSKITETSAVAIAIAILLALLETLGVVFAYVIMCLD